MTQGQAQQWQDFTQWSRRVGRDLLEFLRKTADWLERLSWWRVLLLVIVISILGGWLQDSLQSNVRRIPKDLHYEVKVEDDGSVRVLPQSGPVRRNSRDEQRRRADEDLKAATDKLKDFVTVQSDRGDRVSIGANGVQIDSQDGDGRHTRLVVDNSGVHVLEGKAADEAADQARADAQRAVEDAARRRADLERGGAVAPNAPDAPAAASAAAAAPAAPVAASAGPAPLATIRFSGRLDDAQMRDALGELRDQMQSLANEQRTERRSNFLSDLIGALTAVLIISAGLLKIEGGRRRKAERRALKATEFAESEQLKRQLSEARMQAMQAQVEPHFLFNTLASIDHLIETDPARASAMQKNLITYLRTSIPKMREQATTLGREVDLVRAYLDILKMRMEDRLTVEVLVPEGLRSAVFPPMMLQSVVENAIKHGLEPSSEPGEISIRADVVDGALRVTVADTGIGFDPANARTTGTGLGLANIRERLAAMHDRRARLTVIPNRPRGAIVVFELPYLTTSTTASTTTAPDAASGSVQ